MEKNIESHVAEQASQKLAYARPQLVKQGRVEDLTQDHLGDLIDCSQPVN